LQAVAKTDQELAQEEINNRQYMYGGLGPFSQFLSGERREILRPESTQVAGFAAGPSGVEYITETIPAEYGPAEYDPSFSPVRRGLSALGDMLGEAPSFFGLRGPDEQVEAIQGVGSSLRDALFGGAEYMSEQARAAASGGEYFDPETGRTVAFDPTVVMFGGNPAEGAVMGSGLRMPPLSNAQRTQLGASTLPSYQKARNVLGEGRTLDFGAGRGQGASEIGADTFEPYPREGFSPTYSSAADIPDESYKNLTSLNVLNVMPKDVRDQAVADIGRVLAPGGRAVVTTRGRDVLNAKGTPGREPMSIITTADTYQKGFTQPELRDYMQAQLGEGFTISNLPEKIGQAGVLIEKTASPTALYSGGRTGTGIATASALRNELERQFGGPIPEIGRDSTLLGRVGDVRRVNEMDVEMSAPQLTSFPIARAEDLIDRAYMTGITDTSRPGLERVTAVNGVPVDSLQRGGFGFGMQPNNIDRGIAFASAENAVRAQLNRARQAQSLSGRPGVIFAPHGMVGPSPDFATMSTDIAVPYAQRVLSQSDKNILDKRIREGTDSKAALIPDFPGIDRATPEYLSSIGGKRKSILQALDEKGPQEAGALSRSQIRAIVTEPSEVDAPFGQVNAFYELNPDYYAGTNPLDPVMSDHPSYAFALSGRPIGLAREGFSIFDLDPSIFGVDKRPAANFMDLLARRRAAAEQSLSDMRLKGADSEELGKASGKLKGYDFPGLYGDGNYGSSVQGMIKAGGQGRITQEMVDDLLRRGLIID
jgi:hypothetical protein